MLRAGVILLLVEASLACLSGQRRGSPQLQNVQSASIDIPIHLDIQKGPVPHAHFSVGVDSKVNQHLGDDNYRQVQQTGNFQFNAAAVPNFNAQRKIDGVSADFNVNMDQNQKVNMIQGNPLDRTKVQAEPVLETAGQVRAQQPPVPLNQAADPSFFAETPVIIFQDPTEKHAKHHLPMEYLIAITVVGGVIALALLVVMVVLVIRLKNRSPVTASQEHGHGHGHGHGHAHSHRVHYSDNVYAKPPSVIVTEVVAPPAYDKDETASAKF